MRDGARRQAALLERELALAGHDQDGLRADFLRSLEIAQPVADQVDRELILAKLPLLYTLIDNPDYQTDQNAQNKGLTRRLLVSLPDDKTPYLPFQVGKFWVGVIPQGMEKNLQIDLSEEEYKMFVRGTMDGTKFKNKSIVTSVLLKPIMADEKSPMIEGGMPVFLMMSDVASLSIRGLSDELLWGYSAPWYLGTKSQELMTLHK